MTIVSESVSDYTLDSDFLFKGDYKCLKKAVAYARETVDNVAKITCSTQCGTHC